MNHYNINLVHYIIIWLSYMLNLKSHDNISNLKEFYDQYINNGKEYIKAINGVSDYNSYKDLIDQKKYLMNFGTKDMSKFYDAFKLLCEMYTEFDATTPTNKNYLDCAKKIVTKYKELNEDSSITENNSCSQIFYTLLNDYYDLKINLHSSSSSIVCKLIPVLSIFSAISIFWGISYKYSLFEFRKRVQKQYLREKLKK
ncbi:Plasmodium variant antigen protein Cir/Yir/Bir, putative [Plasmodium berghei]|uniref:Plasmodium variant antigen protein Cir/Yir/Bir, putative n=1 Tax=Plasmodium berghei TaxID=5821 RepID=A0A113QKS7_PLABE|nr:Plasmodium variant antigen protein Cir/Yir/Bir, putative [Plasmodium berghei]SBW38298.1 Plasmodium variant antigen protein Cir/Yir/Bir, putative [Plasmodium berghei]SCL82426.1 Plasmodium variant antigen protein Cir/Yir/Bir, putative [Plasmodium berghei]SCL85796.1 Plasmodium variant antigen protein Cir/Yir/Bir, putative [Plasmodium berghei]SCL86196.1 Plasmodium variant antigen protein Cir/Yir/Bir, putative [Plasmodium berghei]